MSRGGSSRANRTIHRVLHTQRESVMRTNLEYCLMGAALLGACFLIGKAGVGPTASAAELAVATAPAGPAANAAALDVATALPVVFDYRPLVAAQDISGLKEGTHTFELDVYAPIDVGWSREAESLVTAGISVLHVDDRKAAAVRVSFGPAATRSARHVRVEMDLTAAGSWVVILGEGLVAAHADPELLAHYEVPAPETLEPSGSYEFLNPGLMLRTVGHCNHVSRVTTEADERGTLRTIQLHFSEPLSPADFATTASLGVTDPEGKRLDPVRSEGVTVNGDVLELRVPSLRGDSGALTIPLAGIPAFAGHFRETLSCAEADGSMAVGYIAAAQVSDEVIVAPLHEAESRALGEDRK